MIKILMPSLILITSFNIIGCGNSSKNITEKIVNIPSSRSEVTQRFILTEPIEKDIKAIAILFTGGSGELFLEKSQNNRKLNNFLIRSRNLFAKNKILAISIDRPSDRKTSSKKTGGMYNFRDTDEHKKDILSTINYIKNLYPNKKIWLIGTSRGTESVASLAIKFANMNIIDGIVLTASISVNSYRGGTAPLSMELNKITVPTAILSHSKDGCIVSPVSTQEDIKDRLTSISTSKLYFNIDIKGGDSINANPCKADTYHGFLGIENKVVDMISNFIEKHNTSRP